MSYTKKDILQERKALIEMYKAGFLDAYKLKNKIKTDEEMKTLNKFYKLAFFKRFEQKITKALKEKEK
jgi:hypothetical protein